MCRVSTTSEHLLQLHLNGAKHKKRLKRQFNAGNVAAVSAVSVTVVAPVEKKKAANNEVSDPRFAEYKTPSGKFYCPACDVSLTSEIQLKQHMESKKHDKKVLEKKQQQQPQQQ